MTVSTSAALMDLLREADVLSPEEFSRAESLVGDNDNLKAAARRLVKENVLTRWQASQLVMGSSLLSLGKYVLLDRLPWGSTHAVFLATHPMMERKVALNVLDRKRSSNPKIRDGFLADARAIAGLNHRNLIHVFDVDEAEERYFLVMEHVEGRSLHELVKSGGPVPLDQAADVLKQIADGLQGAHEKNLVHGGLRPSNVLLDDQGGVKIVDLGMAKFEDLTHRPDVDEADSKVMSVAEYLAPEQATGAAPTAAADVYSLGCIGYWLLAGQSPFGMGTYEERLKSHQQEAPDVRKVREDVPEALADIVRAAMHLAPGDRTNSAKQFADDLQAWWSEYSAQQQAAKPKPKPKPKAKPASAPQAAAAAPKSNGAKPAPAPSKPPAAAPPPPRSGQPAPAKAPNKAPAKAPAKSAAKASPAAPAVSAASAAAQPAAPATADTAREIASDTSPSAAAAPEAAESTPPKKSNLVLWIVLGAVALVVIPSALVVALLLVAPTWFVLSAGDDEVAAVTDEGTETAPADSDAGQGEESSGSENSGGENAGENSGENNPEDGGSGGEDPALPPPGEGDPENPDGGEDPMENTDPPDENNPPEENNPPDKPPKEKPPKEKPPKEKPPQKTNPFKAVPPAVALPELPSDGQPAPAVLANIDAPAETAVYIDLVGGDRVAPKEKEAFTLERARNGLADREWELKLQGRAEGDVIVAKMELKDKKLQFAWTGEAAALEATPYLCNCALNLRTADKDVYMGLRPVESRTALPYRLDKALLRERLTIDHPPRKESIFVEFTGVGGFKKFEALPKNKLTVDRDSTTVRFGEADAQVAGAKVDTAMQKDLQLTMAPLVKGEQWVPFNQRQLETYYATLNGQIRQLDASLKAVDKARLDNKQKKQAKDRFNAQLKAAEAEMEKLTKLGTELKAIAEKNVFVKYRVYYDAGGHTVDLIVGDAAPEPPQVPAAGKRE